MAILTTALGPHGVAVALTEEQDPMRTRPTEEEVAAAFKAYLDARRAERVAMRKTEQAWDAYLRLREAELGE